MVKTLATGALSNITSWGNSATRYPSLNETVVGRRFANVARSMYGFLHDETQIFGSCLRIKYHSASQVGHRAKIPNPDYGTAPKWAMREDLVFAGLAKR